MSKVIILLVLLIGLLQYKLWYGEGNVREFKRLNDRIAELRQEGAKRRERNAALEAEVMDLKQGLDAVEERARHELGMVMDGEEFVQVIDPLQEPETTVAPAPENPSAQDTSPVPARASKKSLQKKKAKPTEAVKSTEFKAPGDKPATAPPVKRQQPKKPPSKPKPIPAEPIETPAVEDIR